ncbi:hypothetical protein F8M41_023932 [Gigaspora margarita]|uniref:Uncharacterized protein n=1 Tax=Gigaspora margarita TaxID=4874 RepID=A0A8H4ACI6_GIGMA|nr:hypothetical protein F8M41_023932 [Gigaspora margarita]
MLQEKFLLDIIGDDELVENDPMKGKFAKGKRIKNMRVGSEAIDPVEDKYKEEHAEVERVKDKAVESVESEHVRVEIELVEGYVESVEYEVGKTVEYETVKDEIMEDKSINVNQS